MNSSSTDKTGLAYAALAYTLWGILPIYWKLLEKVPAYEILLHRILWSFLLVISLLWISKKINKLKEIFSQPKTLAWVSLSSLLISINWFLYIWAVNSSRVVEASLGYYINPLIVILLGMLIFKERLSRLQIIAVSLATIGVIIPLVEYGNIPWVALALAFSFGFYGLTKKLTKLDALTGLTMETMVVTPVALVYFIWLEVTGGGSLGHLSVAGILILIGSGVATATPLLLFASAARRIPMSAIGFMQYLAPSISLTIGVFLYHEPFTKINLISFSFIWIASVIYIFSQVNRTSFRKKKAPQLS